MSKAKPDFFGKNSMRVCGTAILGERGQIVVPKEARNRLKLKNGDQFLVVEHFGKLILVPQKMMRDLLAMLNKHLK
ncbi:MAG: AbrB/MazE/SpoVT family DNA-binding domain-containing protein [Candidatus Magasanikbacteria bacterium]|nr:AbrB/MazE/SpoVT family DNA-binding domain-containing protein [Candidatus Magasanikbacteria bacterium]